MQEKEDKNGTFLARTDALAEKLRVNVEDLMDILDVGRSSLFGWRTGKRVVTNKAWAKLERAELDAGICVNPIEPPPPVASPNVQSDAVPSEDLREQLNRIESLLEALLKKTGESRTTSSEARGRKI